MKTPLKKAKSCARCLAYQALSGQPHCEKGYGNHWVLKDGIWKAVPSEPCPKPLLLHDYVNTPNKN